MAGPKFNPQKFAQMQQAGVAGKGANAGMGIGWWKESQRHALAAQGVSTAMLKQRAEMADRSQSKHPADCFCDQCGKRIIK
jgi:hypothetical protein